MPRVVNPLLRKVGIAGSLLNGPNGRSIFYPLDTDASRLIGGVPTVASFTPASAFAGKSVVITGTNFTGATAVSFGGTAAASFNVDSSTQITAVVAAGSSGSVSVTTAAGTATKTGFTYVDLNTSLTNFWKFGEGTGLARADSAGGANLTDVNSNCPQVNGIVGKAANFIAANTCVLRKASYTSLDGATKASLSCWMQRTGSGDMVVMGISPSTNNRFHVTLQNDGLVYFVVANAGSAFGSVALAGTGWHHLVLVYDGTQAGNSTRLLGYVDGVVQTLSFTGTIPSALPTFSSNWDVGVVLGVTLANGNADASGLYVGRALTQAEVTQLYNGGTPIEYQGANSWA